MIDTLALAREMFPGKRNSLDALCERFGVDNAHRAVHGALLDAQLLADVYLTMTRGQETLTIDMAPPALAAVDVGIASANPSAPRAALLLVAPTEDELAAHREYLAALERETTGRCVWLAPCGRHRCRRPAWRRNRWRPRDCRWPSTTCRRS